VGASLALIAEMKRVVTSSTTGESIKRQKLPTAGLLDVVSVLLQSDPTQLPLWFCCVNRDCRELVRDLWRQRYPKFPWKNNILFRCVSTALFGEKKKEWKSVFRNLHSQPHPNVAYSPRSTEEIWPKLCDACKLTGNGFVACLLWDYPLSSGTYIEAIGGIKCFEVVRLVDAALQCDSVQLLHRITKLEAVVRPRNRFEDHMICCMTFDKMPPKCIAWIRANEEHWKRFFWTHFRGLELHTRSPVFKTLRTTQDVKDFALIKCCTNNYDITEIYREFLSSIVKIPDAESATAIREVGQQLGYEVLKEEMEQLARHAPTERSVSIYLFIKELLPRELRRNCRRLTLDWRFEVGQRSKNRCPTTMFNSLPNAQFDPMRLPPHAYLEHCHNSIHLLNLILHVQRKGSDNAFAPLLPRLAERFKRQPEKQRTAAFDFLLQTGKSRASLATGAELERLTKFLYSA